jgi:hypothetical protein
MLFSKITVLYVSILVETIEPSSNVLIRVNALLQNYQA